MTTNTVEARSLSSLGGPPGLPVIGNLLQFDIARLHQKLEHWARDYGPIFRVRIGPRLRVCVTDTDAINHMLRERPELYRRPQVTASVMDEMGFHGVFSQDGEAWRRQRKVVTPALNPAHLSSFYPAMVVTTERLLQRWHNAAAANMSVDACRELMRYTVDVTAHLAFGIDVNTLETDGAVIQQHLDKVFPMLFRRVVAPFPIWRYWRSAADRELDKALTEIRATVLEIIADCRQRMHDDQTLYASPTNFLEAIIAAQRTETVEFSEAEIYANVINLLLAGEDTTANTIAWAMSFFMSHPAMFGVARDEVDAVLGDAKVVKDLNDLRRLPYLEAFALETMRLKPVAPLLGIEPKQDVDLLGYRIPAGTGILASTRVNAVSAEHFAAPTTFNPQRWLDAAPDSLVAHNPRVFLPFGAGPRFCPGRGLAMVEIKAVLAMLCRNFDIVLANPEVAVTERLAFTMFPEHLDVRLSARRDSSQLMPI